MKLTVLEIFFHLTGDSYEIIAPRKGLILLLTTQAKIQVDPNEFIPSNHMQKALSESKVVNVQEEPDILNILNLISYRKKENIRKGVKAYS